MAIAVLLGGATGVDAQEAFPAVNPVVLAMFVGTTLDPVDPYPAVAATAPAEAIGGGPVAAEVAGPVVATFRDEQLGFPRVRRAAERKGERVDSLLDARGIAELAAVFFRVFKREQVLEVWARDRSADTFVLLDRYPVCKTSGQLGPKRRQGDRQVPEGFYHIDLFNPWSNYHLSMRVDYPNDVDRVRGHPARPGGDIFIHGDCVTIGCVPVTDDLIEEVYVIAVAARAAGQDRIPVHIFPTHLGDQGLRWLRQTYGADHIDFPFWKNLQEGYLSFEERRVVPDVRHDRGRYLFPMGVPADS